MGCGAGAVLHLPPRLHCHRQAQGRVRRPKAWLSVGRPVDAAENRGARAARGAFLPALARGRWPAGGARGTGSVTPVLSSGHFSVLHAGGYL